MITVTLKKLNSVNICAINGSTTTSAAALRGLAAKQIQSWESLFPGLFAFNASPQSKAPGDTGARQAASIRSKGDMLTRSDNIMKSGEIEIRETKKGIQFRGFNFQQRKQVHFGTIVGVTYEKEASILWSPEPSFCLNRSEFDAVKEWGARFIRIIPNNSKTQTCSISVEDFDRYKQLYRNASYGEQWRVPKIYFASIAKVAKRNARIDNPVIEQPGLQIRQISLFQ